MSETPMQRIPLFINTKNLSKKSGLVSPDLNKLVIDPKSPISRHEQISRQITRFTNNQNRYLRHKISTDHFKELIEIEKEFGPLFTFSQSNQQSSESSLWTHVAQTLNFNRKQWKGLLQKIN